MAQTNQILRHCTACWHRPVIHPSFSFINYTITAKPPSTSFFAHIHLYTKAFYSNHLSFFIASFRFSMRTEIKKIKIKKISYLFLLWWTDTGYLLTMKWQWTYGPTLLPWFHHFHTSCCLLLAPFLVKKSRFSLSFHLKKSWMCGNGKTIAIMSNHWSTASLRLQLASAKTQLGIFFSFVTATSNYLIDK